jgi:hypothetical protein
LIELAGSTDAHGIGKPFRYIPRALDDQVFQRISIDLGAAAKE